MKQERFAVTKGMTACIANLGFQGRQFRFAFAYLYL